MDADLDGPLFTDALMESALLGRLKVLSLPADEDVPLLEIQGRMGRSEAGARSETGSQPLC